jgi:hypothetical protein
LRKYTIFVITGGGYFIARIRRVDDEPIARRGEANTNYFD